MSDTIPKDQLPEVGPEVLYLLGRCGYCCGPTHGYFAPMKRGQRDVEVWLPLCLTCLERSERMATQEEYGAFVVAIAAELQRRIDAWPALLEAWCNHPDVVRYD